MTRLKTLVLGLWAAGAIGAAQAHSRVFIMDGNSGALNFSCDVMGVMPVEGAFTRFIAVITIDDEAPGDARAVVKVDANSLTTNETDWIEDLKGPDFFNVAVHPEFDFASHTTTVEGPGLLRIVGALTLRGESHPVTLHVRYQTPDAPGGPAAVTAEGEIDRTEFGMDAYDLVLSDTVEIEVTGMARPGYPPPVALLSALP
jgi:polyisoprenoid-binding protein YceI